MSEAGAGPAGKVQWALTMSLDGFIAGPNHEMDWMTGTTNAPGLVDGYVAATGAILGGRRGFDGAPGPGPYGGRWSGPIFVLTHHPEDATPVEGITFLSGTVAAAVETGLAAARGKNLQIFGADVARQCLAEGLIDEFCAHIAPVMLGGGIRLFDCPGIEPVRWERMYDGDPLRSVDVRYRPATR